jgi:hypothetical protein
MPKCAVCGRNVRDPYNLSYCPTCGRPICPEDWPTHHHGAEGLPEKVTPGRTRRVLP